jgi:hypothetical protein
LKVGNSNLVFHLDGATDTPTMAARLPLTSATTRVILAGVGRYLPGTQAAPIPTDSLLSIYQRTIAWRPYRSYPEFGNSLFGAVVTGQANDLTIAVDKSNGPQSEMTLAVVEVFGGSKISSSASNYVDAALTQQGPTVTTSGPAILVAWWWGGGATGSTHVATPRNGFQIAQALTKDDKLIQCTVATRAVTAAGTYDVSWATAGNEDANLWLVAIE